MVASGGLSAMSVGSGVSFLAGGVFSIDKGVSVSSEVIVLAFFPVTAL